MTLQTHRENLKTNIQELFKKEAFRKGLTQTGDTPLTPKFQYSGFFDKSFF